MPTKNLVSLSLTRRRAVGRSSVLETIGQRLDERGQDLAAAIAERELYFRISVVGTCNLSCTFCHNEGAPTSGKITLAAVERAIQAAVEVGFTRVQFTGGEPLLRPDIGEFVGLARHYVTDVGVTTNGTYLPLRLDDLVENGLHRLHVSLQVEPLTEAGRGGKWGLPDWLMTTVRRSADGEFGVRFNLPVPADCLDRAEAFLHLITEQGVDVKVFSVLPEGELRDDAYPLAALEAVVARVNAANAHRVAGEVFIRGFRPPAGVRCPGCAERERCLEQSHSLRLGADLQLRPCLATREWDSAFPPTGEATDAVRRAALLALDYRW